MGRQGERMGTANEPGVHGGTEGKGTQEQATHEDETFSGADWYGEEIIDRTYGRCTLWNVDLTEAISRGALFEECTFHNVRFNASEHTDSAFLRCVFRACNLFEARFTGCKLT